MNQEKSIPALVEVAKVIWSQRSGSDVIPWGGLEEVARQCLLRDARAVIAVYNHARFDELAAFLDPLWEERVFPNEYDLGPVAPTRRIENQDDYEDCHGR